MSQPSTPPISPVATATTPAVSPVLSAFADQFTKDRDAFAAKIKQGEERLVALRAEMAEVEKTLLALSGGRDYCSYCLRETQRLTDEAIKATLGSPVIPPAPAQPVN